MTNREKFKEVFGFTPNKAVTMENSKFCIVPEKVCMDQKKCDGCPFANWWDKEYKPCFRIRAELDE